MRTDTNHRAEFGDFTEENYRKLLRQAAKNYLFVGYRDTPKAGQILWRHDVDVSMHRALKLAEIEASEGVMSTYFLYPRSIFYNLLSTDIQRLVRRILSLGHHIAVHFDPTHLRAGFSQDELLVGIEIERELLIREFGAQPQAVSFHLYGNVQAQIPDDDELAGLVNAYSKRLRETCGYVSDSNGIWLYRRLSNVLTEAQEERLHVLTHPEWWTSDVMSPRLRLQRAIDGYGVAMGRWYDDVVEYSKRPNLR